MGNYRLKITLLSDLCVSDGGVYNSALDTDICHDELGFPYIPAKRLKGCLRECALELNDWGKSIPIQELFGKGGARAGALRLGNAYPLGYEEMREAVLAHRDTLVCHPQNVLNHFSYIRTQTSIDYKTGVADDTSLRTMRVVNKGAVFAAEAELDECYFDSLDSCCRILKSMGIARTRGLGEVKVKLEGTEAGKNTAKSTGKKAERQTAAGMAPWKDGADCLVYSLYLEEPMICKSVNGGESRTKDYIEGSKILGLAAQQMKEDGQNTVDLMSQGELFFSNAYIEQDGIRMLEVPATYYSIKNNKTDFVDKLYETGEARETEREKKRQLNQMKHCYTTLDKEGRLVQCGVELEERYHHRRPEDKSIGRACEKKDGAEGKGDSMFYQMSSIMSGQSFQGYILGNTEQIETIYGYLSRKQNYYMGYSRSAEYGKVRLEIRDVYQRKAEILKDCRDFTVKLEAPAILYNRKAMYSTDVRDLIDEVNALLGISGAQVDKYVNYTTVGGYNVTWNERKPVIEAFDKGTVLHYHLDEAKSIPAFLLLGERVTEGYGEATVAKTEPGGAHYQGRIAEAAGARPEKKVDVSKSEFLKSICDDLFFHFIRIEAVQAAKNASLSKKDAMKPTVSNLIQICKENDSLLKIEEAAKARFQKKSEKKKSKYEEAGKILRAVKDHSLKLLPGFQEKYQVENYSFCEDTYQCAYLSAYVNELKYQFRRAEEEKREKEREKEHE